MLDVFGSHERVLDAHRRHREPRCISSKEDSNVLHANQIYDQFMARNDKKVAAKTLSSQRKITHTQNRVLKLDQWSFVHTGIALVVAKMQEMWQSSFDDVNLHPLGRKYFDASLAPESKCSSMRVKQ